MAAPNTNYWLVKTDPDDYSIDDFARDKSVAWVGVRNYQARNFMQNMKPGEAVIFYHSACEAVGITGLARIKRACAPDKTQFDAKSQYYDPKATPETPRWFCPELEFVRKFHRLIPLAELRAEKALSKMLLLKRGSRLSVLPVTTNEFDTIQGLAK